MVGSIPLSPTIVDGLSRRATIASSSRHTSTRERDIDHQREVLSRDQKEVDHDGARNPAEAETLRACIARLPALPTGSLRASWEEDFDE